MTEATSLAEQLVAKIKPNPQQTVNQLDGSMVGMMQQMGIKDPEDAQVIVRETPPSSLTEHVGSLTDRSTATYAETMDVEDLKAIIAFYDTKTDQELINALPALAQPGMQGMNGCITALDTGRDRCCLETAYMEQRRELTTPRRTQ